MKDWIAFARYADKVVAAQNQRPTKGLRIAIKGDQKTNYPTIKQIITTLQNQNINKFNFITNMEGAPATAAE